MKLRPIKMGPLMHWSETLNLIHGTVFKTEDNSNELILLRTTGTTFTNLDTGQIIYYSDILRNKWYRVVEEAEIISLK